MNPDRCSKSCVDSRRSLTNDCLRPIFACLVCMLSFCLGSGCDYDGLSPYKSLPAPLATRFPYEMEDCIRKVVWGGDNMEISKDGVLHYILLRGIATPKPGQRYFGKARRSLQNKLTGKSFNVSVHGVDDFHRELGTIVLAGRDVNLQLIEEGLAWYDGDTFPGSEKYQAAELEAKKSRLNIWSKKNPVHPDEWEDHQKTKQQSQEAAKKKNP